MHIINRATAPRYQRDGIESFLLASAVTTGAQNLAVSLVEMQPGGFQHVHAHEPEQMYFVLEGAGRMQVDDETRSVIAGDCIFIPSGKRHGFVNTGEGALKYLSAASPSFTAEECDTLWPLESLNPKG
jgi:mannose-6-phosphate isomerase-like protein (cupin superfamily)